MLKFGWLSAAYSMKTSDCASRRVVILMLSDGLRLFYYF